MLFDETAVRDNIRNRDGQRVFYLGSGDKLTPSARDYLQSRRIPILPASEAAVQRWELPGGGYMEEKPEHMTHLNGQMLVLKTHPRIALRGMLDTLEAELLLLASKFTDVRKDVQEILALSRRLMHCDVLEEPVGSVTLCGMTEQEQRQRSHFPQKYYDQPHFMPEPTDQPVVLGLNKCRCLCRQTELAAVRAYSLPDGTLSREDIPMALNRMSSMLYLLMIRQKRGKG